MSEKTIGTNVIVVSANHLSEDEQERIMQKYDADSIQEVADKMSVSSADELPIIDVSAKVYENWDEDDANALAQR